MTMSGHTVDDQSLPKVGDLIVGKYRIEKLIGKGGMGAVFAAQHELLGQRVAVKFLLGDIVTNQEAVQRFLNEARNAAKIQSEHVCRVMDVGTAENGLPYMVLEFLQGVDLSQRLEQGGPLGVEEAVDYTLQALEAIAQAHALGIVHRDLKPANLFLAHRTDGSPTVKVLDFGIAKASNPFGEGGNHSLTSTKSMLGSPLYMSPEQLRSAKNVDARADVWALGVILYELLTGVVPFNGESLGELFIAILEQPPAPIITKRGDIPQALSDAIGRCLIRAPEQRFQNVAELAQAIASCAPARSFASIDRITTTLGMPRPSMVIPQAGVGGYNAHAQSSGGYRPPSPSYVDTAGGRVQANTGSGAQNVPPQTNTNASWGNTSGEPQPASKAPLFAAIGVAALLVLGVGAVGIYKVTHKTAATDPKPVSTIATVATTAVPPPTVTAPTATMATTTTALTTTPAVSTTTTNTPPHSTNTVVVVKPPGSATGKPTSDPVTPPSATTKPTAKPSATYDPFGGR